MKWFAWPILLALLMLAGAAILMVGSTPPGPPARSARSGAHDHFSETHFCARQRQGAAEAMAEVPKMLDSVTRLDRVSVDCAARIMLVDKTVLASRARMRPGWRAQFQAGANHIICDNAALGPMARRGWRFADRITFADGAPEWIEVRC